MAHASVLGTRPSTISMARTQSPYSEIDFKTTSTFMYSILKLEYYWSTVLMAHELTPILG